MRPPFDANVATQANLTRYYRGLAAELAAQPTRIHSVPQRQEEFARLVAAAQSFADSADILELACGVGFWTGLLASCARSIVAVDICDEALDIARTRVSRECVSFIQADALALDLSQRHQGKVFAAFWLSHVRRCKLAAFLESLHRQLQPGTEVFFIENEYPDRASRPFEAVTHAGDTYELRRLRDGSTHLVLKNYFSDAELSRCLTGYDAHITRSHYYWSVRYQV